MAGLSVQIIALRALRSTARAEGRAACSFLRMIFLFLVEHLFDNTTPVRKHETNTDIHFQ